MTESDLHLIRNSCLKGECMTCNEHAVKMREKMARALAESLEKLYQNIKGEQKMDIAIPRERYESLIKSEATLNALENAGVDNWSGYGFAMELLEES